MSKGGGDPERVIVGESMLASQQKRDGQAVEADQLILGPCCTFDKGGGVKVTSESHDD